MNLSKTLEALYESLEGSEMAEEYSARHGIDSASVLTIYNDFTINIYHKRGKFLPDRLHARDS